MCSMLERTAHAPVLFPYSACACSQFALRMRFSQTALRLRQVVVHTAHASFVSPFCACTFLRESTAHASTWSPHCACAVSVTVLRMRPFRYRKAHAPSSGVHCACALSESVSRLRRLLVPGPSPYCAGASSESAVHMPRHRDCTAHAFAARMKSRFRQLLDCAAHAPAPSVHCVCVISETLLRVHQHGLFTAHALALSFFLHASA